MNLIQSLLPVFFRDKELLHPEGRLIRAKLYSDGCYCLEGSDGWSSWNGKCHAPHSQFSDDTPIETWEAQ